MSLNVFSKIKGSQSLTIHQKEQDLDPGLQFPFALQPSPAHPPRVEKSHLAEGCQLCNLARRLLVTSAGEDLYFVRSFISYFLSAN